MPNALIEFREAARGCCGPALRRLPWAFVLECLLVAFFVALAFDARGIANGLEAGALACGLLAVATSRSRRFGLPGWCFVIGLLLFFATGAVATVLHGDEPGVGRAGIGRIDLFSTSLALATGLGVRGAEASKRLLNALLLVFGAYYAIELVRVPYQDCFVGGRLCGTRDCAAAFGMELSVMAMLFWGRALFAQPGRTRLAAAAGGVLATAHLAMTQTRSALLAFGLVGVPLLIAVWHRVLSPARRLAAVGAYVLLLVLPATLF
jgi:hypothetical protein